jgi:hypothetical protein
MLSLWRFSLISLILDFLELPRIFLMRSCLEISVNFSFNSCHSSVAAVSFFRTVTARNIYSFPT